MGQKVKYSLHSVKKSYLDEDGKSFINVLRGVELEISEGEIVGIVGPSGSGKSTLLHILGFMDRDFIGDLYFDDKNFHTMSETERNHILRTRIGFLFQYHFLLNELNIWENITLPLRIGGLKTDHKEIMTLLESLGLAGKEKYYPYELSGGEKQKAALARALVKHPEVMFCDEPTGNLDSASSESIKGLLESLHNERQFTLVIVTHNYGLLKGLADKTYQMKDGKLSGITLN